eukprot:3577381-Prymnesium_polylepis.1
MSSGPDCARSCRYEPWAGDGQEAFAVFAPLHVDDDKVDGRSEDCKARSGGDEGYLNPWPTVVVLILDDHERVAVAVDHRIQRREVPLLEIAIHPAVHEQQTVAEQVCTVSSRKQRVVGTHDPRLCRKVLFQEGASRTVAKVAHGEPRIGRRELAKVRTSLRREELLVERPGLPEQRRDRHATATSVRRFAGFGGFTGSPTPVTHSRRVVGRSPPLRGASILRAHV